MEYIRLGRTGLQVSRICLGTMTYGSSRWRDWVLDEEAARPFIQHVGLAICPGLVRGRPARLDSLRLHAESL